jgi:eukaryotic-like serine/threonine-protein kinase
VAAGRTGDPTRDRTYAAPDAAGIFDIAALQRASEGEYYAIRPGITRYASWVILAGRYQLLEPVGQGGMGSVWRASDLVLDREVAIKILTEEASRPRFRREAVVLARLNHPRLGRVYDYSEDGDTAFIVLEYLTGLSLARKLPLPPDQAAQVVAQAAEGLHAAHQAGVVHRDVKPANVILTPHGAQVVDFGIATALYDERLTEAGTLVGSAPYLAPEFAAGQPASPASDIYSLGVVLYETLTGQPPFASGHPLETLDAHVHSPVPPLPWHIPEPIAACCLRALEKDPARRPATALELARTLTSAANGMPAPARAADAARHTQVFQEPVPGPARRPNKWLLAVAAVSGALLTAVALLTAASLRHPSTPRTAPAQKSAAVTRHTIPGAYASFAKTLNNAGISAQAQPSSANFDGVGFSFQQEALSAAGYLPGAQVEHDGISFTWPSGAPDDTVATGQTFLISGPGTHLAFLGASAYGSAGGVGEIRYTDGTQQPFRLVMDDWASATATAGQDEVAVTTSQVDSVSGVASRPGSVYFVSIPLRPGKVIEAVTLPTTGTPAQNVPSLHIFAVSIG